MKRKINGDTVTVVTNTDETVLTITVSSAADTAKLVVSGNITHDAAPEFEDELMAVLTSGRDVIVDFSSLDSISAPALKALLTVQRLVDEKRYKFYIENITASVKKIFEQTGYIDLLDIRGVMGEET